MIGTIESTVNLDSLTQKLEEIGVQFSPVPFEMPVTDFKNIWTEIRKEIKAKDGVAVFPLPDASGRCIITPESFEVPADSMVETRRLNEELHREWASCNGNLKCALEAVLMQRYGGDVPIVYHNLNNFQRMLLLMFMPLHFLGGFACFN